MEHLVYKVSVRIIRVVRPPWIFPGELTLKETKY